MSDDTHQLHLPDVFLLTTSRLFSFRPNSCFMSTTLDHFRFDEATLQSHYSREKSFVTMSQVPPAGEPRKAREEEAQHSWFSCSGSQSGIFCRCRSFRKCFGSGLSSLWVSMGEKRGLWCWDRRGFTLTVSLSGTNHTAAGNFLQMCSKGFGNLQHQHP